MIHAYMGEGKGKTTSAMGLALRASGRSKSVVIAQFLKGNTSGEILQFENIDGVQIFKLPEDIPFVFQMSEEVKQKTLNEHNRIFQKAVHFVNAGYCEVLVLDELSAAIETNLIATQKVRNFLESIPADIEVIITGRNMPHWILDCADYVTEMVLKKHPFNNGCLAREGIEF